METGSNTSSLSSLFKKEFHLRPDNEGELNASGLRSFVAISRSRIQLLKVDASLKAIEMISFAFPNSEGNERWLQRISEFHNSADFSEFTDSTEISYSIADSHVSIIPRSIYSDEKRDVLYGFTKGSSKETVILKQEIENLDAVGLFAIPKNLETVLNGSVSSSYFLWLDQTVRSNQKITADLYLEDGKFALVVSKESELLFSNWFNISTADDVLYFLMASLEGLKILHTGVSVALSGDVKKNDRTHLTLRKYIPNISFATRPSTLKYAYSFKEIAEHRFPFIFHASCA